MSEERVALVLGVVRRDGREVCAEGTPSDLVWQRQDCGRWGQRRKAGSQIRKPFQVPE